MTTTKKIKEIVCKNGLVSKKTKMPNQHSYNRFSMLAFCNLKHLHFKWFDEDLCRVDVIFNYTKKNNLSYRHKKCIIFSTLKEFLSFMPKGKIQNQGEKIDLCQQIEINNSCNKNLSKFLF